MVKLASFFFVLFFSSIVYAEPTKTVFNPFTGKLDYITRVDSTTISGLGFVLKTGDTMTGDLTFGTDSIGPIITDSASCTWRITVATTGNLITNLLSCPGAGSGECMGILCAITYGP